MDSDIAAAYQEEEKIDTDMIMEHGELVHLSYGENPTILDNIYGEIEESK